MASANNKFNVNCRFLYFPLPIVLSLTGFFSSCGKQGSSESSTSLQGSDVPNPGPKGNRPPTSVAAADVASGDAPL